MEKAAKAVRRSGARLLGAAHGDLNVLISELKVAKTAAKAFRNSQTSVSQHMVKWAAGGENTAIQDVIVHVDRLNQLWGEVQEEFTAQLKELRHTFSMILEGEKSVALVKNNLNACEQKETKNRKELNKAHKNATNMAAPNMINQLECRVSQAELASNHAHMAALATMKENEAVKLIRVKDGLARMSEAYVALGRKCAAIFECQAEVVGEIPDVCDRDIEELTYSGYSMNRERVHQTQLLVQAYQRPARLQPPTLPQHGLTTPHVEITLPGRQKAAGDWLGDLPPPYSVSPGLSTQYLHTLSPGIAQHSGRRSCPTKGGTTSRSNPRRQSTPAYEHR